MKKFLVQGYKFLFGSLLGVVAVLSPLRLQASVISENTCRPTLHGDIGIRSGSLLIRDRDNLFRIDPKGNLFFDVHKVALTAEQKDSLTLYSETIRNDVPYFRQSLVNEVRESWQALDKVIVSELGNESQLRTELGQFHLHLQRRIAASFLGRDSMPFFDHQAITETITEIEAGVPIFLSMISSQGMRDLATLSEDQENKMTFIAEKMSMLQTKLYDQIDLQRRRSQDFQRDICHRFARWQHQESTIAELIPALSDWKTVTLR